MTQEEIIKMFKQGYKQYSWKKFLGETFPNARILITPEKITGIDTNMASEALKLGDILLNEYGIERRIAVYEVTLAKGIILERNRVGLRNLLRKYWKNIDAAFIVYHNPENNKWRFSYVSELTGYDASGNFTTIVTEPKRYTYVLGEGESIRTAAERFSILSKKAEYITLDDVKETFSVEKLSKAFFDEYKKHYENFCDYMMKTPSIRAGIFNGDDKAIRDFNKKLLGRIVFLYFIKKKGWLGVPIENNWGSGDLNFLSNIFKQYENPDLFYSNILTRLFFDTLNTKRDNDIIELINGQKYKIPYLNGGLFEEDDSNQRNIIIDGKLFENLFEFFNQYNFTIYEDDPNDQTVAVDPEMLGHIFENLLEDNKDKGAFYTPKNIVHYMCQESLIEYLSTWFENKGYDVINYISFDNTNQPKLFSENETRVGQLILETPIENNNKKIDRYLIEKFLNKNLTDDDKNLILKHADEFNKALDNVKICDPAIGSGAFPMGLLQEIFTAKQTLWHYQYGNLKNFPVSDIKLNIIQNSIYGVDIEKGAVDIARLRFWLSLVVDEDVPKPLPNLDYKIVVGNSLVSKIDDTDIEIDWDLDVSKYGAFANDTAINIKNILKKIVNEQKEYFKPNCDKKKLSTDICKLKIELLINQLKFMIIVKQTAEKNNNTKDNIVKKTDNKLKILEWENTIKKLKELIEQPDKPLNFFDWKLDYPDILNEAINPNPGFDIVIGNPPYIQLQKAYNSKIKFADIYKEQNYKTFDRTGDIYCLFYEKGMQLLKPGGHLCFITSNKWMRAGYGEKLREFFINYNPLQLIDLGPGVFQSATVDTNILIIQKDNNKNQLKAITLQKQEKDNISKAIKEKAVTITKLDKNAWFIGSDAEQRLKEKIERIGKPLKDWDVNIYFGIKTGLNEAFIITTEKRNEILANCQDEAERQRTEAIIKPILRGRDIKRYHYEWAGLWVIVIPAGWTNRHRNNNEPKIFIKKTFPSLMEYLIQFEAKAKKRDDQGDYWWELRACAYYPEFEKEKVVYSEIVRQPQFVYDTDGFYVEATSFLMTGEYVKYFCGLLNSKPVSYFFKKWYAGGGLGDEGYRYKKAFLENLLLPPITPSNEAIVKQIEALVDKIIEAKQANPVSDTSPWEQEIDELVYGLYELTEEEIRIIEGGK